MRTEGETCELGDFAGGSCGKFGMGIEAGAGGGAADGEIVEAVEGHGDAAAVAVEHVDVAGKFLAEGERRGILQMGAADFYDVCELLGFGVERVAKSLDGREQAARGFRGGGAVHGGGKRVVPRLRHMYLPLGVKRVRASHDAGR